MLQGIKSKAKEARGQNLHKILDEALGAVVTERRQEVAEDFRLGESLAYAAHTAEHAETVGFKDGNL